MKRPYNAGRPKIEVYQYDKDGKFIKRWDCINDVRQVYYEGTRHPMFLQNRPYHVLPDETMLVKERIGRKEVFRLYERINNPLVVPEHKLKPVEILNIDGHVVAAFANIKVLLTLTDIKPATVYNHLTKLKGTDIPHNKLRITIRESNIEDL
jgi:hypothetical protein